MVTCPSLNVKFMRLLVSVNVVILQDHVREASVDRNLTMVVPTLKKIVNVDVD